MNDYSLDIYQSALRIRQLIVEQDLKSKFGTEKDDITTDANVGHLPYGTCFEDKCASVTLNDQSPLRTDALASGTCASAPKSLQKSNTTATNVGTCFVASTSDNCDPGVLTTGTCEP